MKKEKLIQQFWNQADKNIHLKQYDKALSCLNECNKLLPNSENILNAIALVSVEMKDLVKAKKYFLKSLTINSNQFSTHLNLGKCNELLLLEDDAFQNYSDALILNPDLIDALVNRALILQDQQKFYDAKRDMEKAISLQLKEGENQIEELYFGLANIMIDLNENKEALSFIEKALAIKPDIRYLISKGNALSNIGELKDNLVSFYEDVLKQYPRSSEAMSNLGFVYMHHNNFNKAEEYFVKSLRINPQNYYAMHNLGNLQLGVGNFKEGWMNYESRNHLDRNELICILKGIPEWLPSSPKNQKLLIWGEQGIGDQILYASMIDKNNFDPKNTSLAVNSKIVKLLQRSFPHFNIISLEHIPKIKETFDLQIQIGSIGKYLRLNIDDFFNNTNYKLIAYKQLTDEIRKKYKKKDKLLCGISWTSSAGKDKNCELNDLIPLFKLKNIEFINLQYGDVSKQFALLKEEFGINVIEVNDLNLYDDVDGLTSLIDACDFIVTTSNINAHIAGALQKDTYLLTAITVKKFHYWHAVNDKSIWYPTVKIFTQERKGKWELPINKCVKTIRDITS